MKLLRSKAAETAAAESEVVAASLGASGRKRLQPRVREGSWSQVVIKLKNRLRISQLTGAVWVS